MCGKNHQKDWDCEYNLTYQRYLLDKLKKVNKVIESKYESRNVKVALGDV